MSDDLLIWLLSVETIESATERVAWLYSHIEKHHGPEAASKIFLTFGKKLSKTRANKLKNWGLLWLHDQKEVPNVAALAREVVEKNAERPRDINSLRDLDLRSQLSISIYGCFSISARRKSAPAHGRAPRARAANTPLTELSLRTASRGEKLEVLPTELPGSFDEKISSVQTPSLRVPLTVIDD